MNHDSLSWNSQGKQKTNEPSCDLFGASYLDLKKKFKLKLALDT